MNLELRYVNVKDQIQYIKPQSAIQWLLYPVFDAVCL